MNRILRRVQLGVLVALAVWVAVHTVLVWQTGWTSWRLGGFGMYAEPSLEYRGTAIVVCGQSTCLDVTSDIRHFMPLRDFEVPLLVPTPSGEARYRLVSSRPARFGELGFALADFRRMATRSHAEALVRERLSAACGPYLVVLYTQHVSMISRKATIESRPFVVDLQTTGCTDERRVLERGS